MKPIALGLALTVALSLPVFAAEPDGPAELITKTEAVRIAIQDELGAQVHGRHPEQIALAEYYSVPDRRLIWVDEVGFTARGKAVMAEIAKADDYGLRAADYDLPDQASFNATQPNAVDQLADAELKISTAVLDYARTRAADVIDPQSLNKNLDPDAFLPNPAEVHQLHRHPLGPGGLSAQLPADPSAIRGVPARTARRARAASPKQTSAPTDVVIPDGPLLKLGVEHGQVALLRKRLEVPVKAGGNENLYDQELFEAVRQFQKRTGRPADGIVGSGTRHDAERPVGAPQVSGAGQDQSAAGQHGALALAAAGPRPLLRQRQHSRVHAARSSRMDADL